MKSLSEIETLSQQIAREAAQIVEARHHLDAQERLLKEQMDAVTAQRIEADAMHEQLEQESKANHDHAQQLQVKVLELTTREQKLSSWEASLAQIGAEIKQKQAELDTRTEAVIEREAKVANIEAREANLNKREQLDRERKEQLALREKKLDNEAERLQKLSASLH